MIDTINIKDTKYAVATEFPHPLIPCYLSWNC